MIRLRFLKHLLGSLQWAAPEAAAFCYVDLLRIPEVFVHPFRSFSYSDSGVFVHPFGEGG